jgi:NAD(P)H-flavin reductase
MQVVYNLLVNYNIQGDYIIPVYSNFREELEDYAADEKFQLLLTLTRVDKVKEFFPEPSEDVLVLICGPKGMNATAKAICEELKYPNIHVY